MTLQQVTQDVLPSVEEATGRPVVVQPDPSLGTLLAKLTMARGSAPAHLVAYNPQAAAVTDRENTERRPLCCQHHKMKE